MILYSKRLLDKYLFLTEKEKMNIGVSILVKWIFYVYTVKF